MLTFVRDLRNLEDKNDEIKGMEYTFQTRQLLLQLKVADLNFTKLKSSKLEKQRKLKNQNTPHHSVL